MSGINKSLLELIGNTPLLELERIGSELKLPARIVAKLECFNPAGSVKDRIGLAMIEDAESRGLIAPGAAIIEATSGNTGIGLALAAAIKGYRMIVTMPENFSIERRKLFQALGAEVALTPAERGMQGAIDKAAVLQKQIKGSFVPEQFKNPSNPEIHRKTTAEEIWKDTGGRVDLFVAGVGTGGTLTGVAEALKAKNPAVQAIAVEPAESAVLSGKMPGPHRIQGIGAGFIPEVLNQGIIDEVIPVKSDDAIAMAKMLGRKEGLLVGISSGAAVFAAVQLARRPENHGKTIVALLPDGAERYMSTELFDE